MCDDDPTKEVKEALNEIRDGKLLQLENYVSKCQEDGDCRRNARTVVHRSNVLEQSHGIWDALERLNAQLIQAELVALAAIEKVMPSTPAPQLLQLSRRVHAHFEGAIVMWRQLHGEPSPSPLPYSGPASSLPLLPSLALSVRIVSFVDLPCTRTSFCAACSSR